MCGMVVDEETYGTSLRYSLYCKLGQLKVEVGMGKGRLKTCIMGIGMGMCNYPQK
jgi:hypothetical protein